jgi:hypothetical protein
MDQVTAKRKMDMESAKITRGIDTSCYSAHQGCSNPSTIAPSNLDAEGLICFGRTGGWCGLHLPIQPRAGAT